MKHTAYLAAAYAALSVNAPAAAQTAEPGFLLEVNVCNKHAETIFVATGGPIEPVGGGFDVRVRGWEPLEPGVCRNLPVETYVDAEQARKVAVFLYAETEGMFGGAIKKVWEGKGWDACLNKDHAKPFTSVTWQTAPALVWKNSCSGPGEFKAGMIRVERRDKDGAVRFDFTSQ